MKYIKMILAFAFFSTTAFADTGYIKWYNPEKGYGFIKADENVRLLGDEFYFKYQNIKDQDSFENAYERLDKVCVTFDLVKIPREGKVEAKNVVMVDCK